jgi:hypothetical protein
MLLKGVRLPFYLLMVAWNHFMCFPKQNFNFYTSRFLKTWSDVWVVVLFNGLAFSSCGMYQDSVELGNFLNPTDIVGHSIH